MGILPDYGAHVFHDAASAAPVPMHVRWLLPAFFLNL